jgi:hypothetical protein
MQERLNLLKIKPTNQKSNYEKKKKFAFFHVVSQGFEPQLPEPNSSVLPFIL